MSWPSFPQSDATGRSRSRVFLYLGLTVVFLLISYQLVLNRELLGSVADWATGTALPSLGFDASNSTQFPNEIPNGYEKNESRLSTESSHATNFKIATPTSTPSPRIKTSVMVSTAAPSPSLTAPTPPREKELVLAAMMKSNMSWVTDNLPGWYSNIYRADASPGQAELTVPANRGNEAMVFLTYLIDRYDSLPDVSLFLHGGRYQWHNDNPLYDSVISIRDLQSAFVRQAGYVNLRCTWAIGCPAELEPARYMRERPDDPGHATAVVFPDSFAELFPGVEMPEIVGVPCCSQFALSREKIHERPVEDYIRVRQWLLDSPLDASITGRVLEYSWHIMFGKPSQFCLDVRECFCNTYGYCNMTDEDLRNQWQWRGLVLPEGWPDVPDAPADPNESTESAESMEPDESKKSAEHVESNEVQNSLRKRRLALADELPDISDTSRQALRDAAV